MQQVNWIIVQIKSVHNLHIHPIVAMSAWRVPNNPIRIYKAVNDILCCTYISVVILMMWAQQ